ncbi:uncharacterized protein [Triticum aestivum]|uniref:uncharacterized protein n=1 Tax=Triticum aestivum TaxID=4565 RepID=UPI001D016C78|nr:uncharacterized protein LOC123168019 [Triticum aestivum]
MATDKKGELLLTEIPDHPLTEILLRACAACSTFRRIATDGSFRRRFRRLHAPPLLGFVDREGFHPPLPPHPAAPVARALARVADFSFSFLPSHCSWTVRDVRDGRVLLARDTDHQEDEQPPVFMDLVVCDPLHRRFILLPPVRWRTQTLYFAGASASPASSPPARTRRRRLWKRRRSE